MGDAEVVKSIHSADHAWDEDNLDIDKIMTARRKWHRKNMGLYATILRLFVGGAGVFRKLRRVWVLGGYAVCF